MEVPAVQRHLASFVAAVLIALPASGQVEFLEESFEYDRDHPAAGHWLGNLQPDRSPDTWASLLIEQGDDGKWAASITILAAMALDTACTVVEIDGRSIAFTVPVPGQPLFRGTVGADGQRFAGSITYGDAEAEAEADAGAEGSFEFARTPRSMDLSSPMAFTGELQAPQGKLGMTIVLAETPGGNWVGHVDVPAQMFLGFPLINIDRDGQAITAELSVVPFPAAITGELAEDERRLTGIFQQGPFKLAIDFARDDEYAQPQVRRPQHPEPPYPYEARDISIGHEAGHVLAGTLTIPEGDGPFPAAVLISGSGPQDRNEEIFGHKPFLVIADHLTRHGIAALRYDDRGVGKSTGSLGGATSRDLATDAVAAVKYLTGVEKIDARRIGLIGHSEGGIIAPMVAGMTDEVDFIVLLAGPGVPGDDLLRVQGELILRASGATEEAIEDLKQQQEEVFGLMKAGVEGEELVAKLRTVVETELKAMGFEGEQLKTIADVRTEQVASPWMRYFLTYDPRAAYRKVRCPVLALNGTLDLQVWHEQNLPEIEKAIRSAGGDITIRRYEGLNHLFQPATTGSIAEYGVIETTFDEQVLRDIVQWIELKSTR
jgi:pimeloyl-ACP methyl ester carboxylesterase